MLKGINPILSPDLLWTLRTMGHGEELAIVDAHFPSASAGPEVIRLDGVTATDVLDAVLSLMPLDENTTDCAVTMQVIGDPTQRVPIVDEFERIIKAHEPERSVSSLERYAFYERANKCLAIVQTGETRVYGNIIIAKGVVA